MQQQPRLRVTSFRLALVIALVAGLLQPVFIGIIQAQTMAPWQAAEAMNRALFEAQKALILNKADEAQSHVNGAAALYDESLATRLAVVIPEAHQVIQVQLGLAQAAISAENQIDLAAARGQIWTGLLWGGYQVTLQAINQNQPEQAQTWLLLREYRPSTRFSRPGADATLAVEALASGAITEAETAAVFNADFLDAYQIQLNQKLEAIENASQEGFAMRQAEAAGMAVGYWRILSAAYETQFGLEARQQTDDAFATLLALETPADSQSVTVVLGQVRQPLRSFRAAPLSPAEEARRAGQLLRFLSLVGVEYDRGVEEGQIIVEFEIQEAVTFIEGGKVAFEDLRLSLETRDPILTEEVERLIETLDGQVQAANRKEAVVPVQTIQDEVDLALAHLNDLYPEEWLHLDADADFDVLASVLDQVEAAVVAGQYDMAESARLEAYAIFDFGPEPRLLAFSPDTVARIDGLFWQGHDGQIGLAQAIAGRASPAEIQATRAALNEALAEAQKILGEGPKSPFAIATNAAVIVFREGLEAVVILAALTASLVGAYHSYRRPVVAGAILAFVATLITGWVAQRILLSFSRFGERLEAIVSLLAVAVLLLITNWFFHKVYWTEWLARFHRQKSRLLGGGAAGQFLGLAALGFSSVYREGFETVLFLQVLLLEAGTWVVLQGVLLGLLGVAAVGFVTFRLQARLPYLRMLIVTGVLIGVVLLIIVGNTVHVMQAVGWLPIHPLRDVDIPYWAGLWFGLFPTWEGIIAQAGAAVFVIGSYYLAEYQNKRKRPVRLQKAHS